MVAMVEYLDSLAHLRPPLVLEVEVLWVVVEQLELEVLVNSLWWKRRRKHFSYSRRK